MDLQQMGRLVESMDLPAVSVSDIADGGDRTLLLGRMCTYSNFHVYLESGLIHAVSYSSGINFYKAQKKWPLQALIPTLRVWPESTDYGLAKLFAAHRMYVPYLMFDTVRAQKTEGRAFHALRMQEVD